MENPKGSAAQYRAEFELLQKKSLADLKIMAKELGVPTSSKLRRKSDWVEAIYEHCSASSEDATGASPDAQYERLSKPESELALGVEQETAPQAAKRKTASVNAQPTRKKLQHNQQNSYAQKRHQPSQNGNISSNGNMSGNRQINYQNLYTPNSYQGANYEQPPYRQTYVPQGDYQSNPYRQPERAPYQQQSYSQDYQRKKAYAQPTDTYRQQVQSYSNIPQYKEQADDRHYMTYQQPPMQYRREAISPDQDEYRQPVQPVQQSIEYGEMPMPSPLEDPNLIDCEAVLEVMQDGYGFMRSNNYLPGQGDVYVSNQQVRRFKLQTGDVLTGKTRRAQSSEKYPPLLFLTSVNGEPPENTATRKRFDELIPIYPNERLTLEYGVNKNLAIRLIDLFSPIGKGQRGLIVSQPKAGKTTLLKQIANGITENYPDVHLIVLLIDERPEEVTDIQRSIKSNNPDNCEVVYSTFDELPDRHTRVAEMVMERSMRLVETGRDVVVLMDSITRLARAYNITLPSTGKTLSGGMDPSALFKPKRFFGAARNIEDGGSLTIIATALVETGSRMDDMVYEEFKGTGNMEIHLDRKLSEKRIFPAIDIYKSGTRHDDLLLSTDEFECIQSLRRIFSVSNTAEVTEQVIGMLAKSSSNPQFIEMLKAWFAKQEKDGYSSTNGR